MLKEAEFINQTGIVYLQENQSRITREIVQNVTPSTHFPPTVFTARTGEDVLTLPAARVGSIRNIPAYLLFAKTTGAELLESSKWSWFPVCYATSARGSTSYQPASQPIDITQALLQARHVEQTLSSNKLRKDDKESPSDRQTASVQAEQLRAMSGLTVEQLATIFGVSRTTYHKWLSDSPLHESHREHLLEVLPLIEKATQHLGSPHATSTWLLTPVSSSGKKPIEYLAAREYAVFRGFLLRARVGQERLRFSPPPRHAHLERSREEVEDARERLRPRMWRDEYDYGMGE